MTQRSWNLAPSTSTFALESSACRVEVLMNDTTYNTREDHSLRYDGIYRMFNTGDFPHEYVNLEVYQNI